MFLNNASGCESMTCRHSTGLLACIYEHVCQNQNKNGLLVWLSYFKYISVSLAQLFSYQFAFAFISGHMHVLSK